MAQNVSGALWFYRVNAFNDGRLRSDAKFRIVLSVNTVRGSTIQLDVEFDGSNATFPPCDPRGAPGPPMKTRESK
jgi:hypothetical protein